MKRQSLLILLFTACIVFSNAQQPCGNPKILPEARRYVDPGVVSRTLAGKLLVRVYFHIFTNNDGTNPAATENDLKHEFDSLTNDYVTSNVCFAFVGWQRDANSNLNNNLYADSAVFVSQVSSYNIPGCLNIYYAKTIRKSPSCVVGPGQTCQYGGNAFSIPSNFCSIATSNIAVWRTISHEVGHCLGLIHTFDTGSGIENINGNNCTIAGDLVCDTPADPYGRGACYTNSGCSYTGTCMDGNGVTNYNPPYNNIMSYWAGQGCLVTNFSIGQLARVNNTTATSSTLQPCISAENMTLTGASGFPVTVSSGFSINSGRDFLWAGNISGSGDYYLNGTARVYLVSTQVRLLPGFRASPTNNAGGFIRIRSVTGCQ